MKCFENILFVTEPVVGDEPAFERVVNLAEENQARLTVVPYVSSGRLCAPMRASVQGGFTFVESIQRIAVDLPGGFV